VWSAVQDGPISFLWEVKIEHKEGTSESSAFQFCMIWGYEWICVEKGLYDYYPPCRCHYSPVVLLLLLLFLVSCSLCHFEVHIYVRGLGMTTTNVRSYVGVGLHYINLELVWISINLFPFVHCMVLISILHSHYGTLTIQSLLSLGCTYLWFCSVFLGCTAPLLLPYFVSPYLEVFLWLFGKVLTLCGGCLNCGDFSILMRVICFLYTYF
jgi:hypothetical protein